MNEFDWRLLLEAKEKEIERLKTDKEQLTSLVNSCQKEIRRLNNIIKEVGEILNNKRDKMIMQQFDCDFEELLYQIDEEIREVIKSDISKIHRRK